MRPWREAIPAIEVQSEEDGLDKKGEPLCRKRKTDDAPGVAHEKRPEQPQLEGEDGAGNGADGEEDGESLGPAPDERFVDRVAGPQPESLGDEEQNRQPHTEDGEDDVKREGSAHLGASGEEIGQPALPTRCVTVPADALGWTAQRTTS